MLKRITSVMALCFGIVLNLLAQTEGAKTHEVKAGETLYSLARTYSVTIDDIKNANPMMDILKSGMVINIPAPNPAIVSKTSQSRKPQCRTTYIVEKKQTVYSICRQFGVTIDEFLAANPQVTKEKIKKGEEVCIPFTKAELEAKRTETQKRETERAQREAEKINRVKSVKVGVILPFELESNQLSTKGQRMIELYEGFLLAVDSLKKSGVNVDIYAFNEKESYGFVDSLIKNHPIFPYLNVVLGPLYDTNIQKLSSYANKHDIQLVVPCSSKYGLADSNPNLFQVNTSENYIYDKVYEYFTSHYSNYNVIFVSMNEKEHTTYINGLKQALDSKNKSYSTIAFSELDNLGDLLSPTMQNVLVPTSNTQNAFEMLCYKLNTMESFNLLHSENITMFGYPQWQTFSAKNQSNLNKYRVSYFSTFYSNANNWKTTAFSNKFKKYFKRDLIKSHPKFGLLGFDSGYYFIKGVWEYGDKFQRHLNNIKMNAYQNPLSFEKVNNAGGFINRVMLTVTHNSDGSINVKEH